MYPVRRRIFTVQTFLLELQLFNRKFYNEYQKMEIKMVNETKIIIKYLSNVFIEEPFIAGNEHYSIFLIFLQSFKYILFK